MSGPVDGQGEFHGYPFLASGSTGFPVADAVFRSYLSHPALEVLPTPDEHDADAETAAESVPAAAA
jgi:hypothetical protein